MAGKPVNGAEALVSVLEANGVDTVFGLPGTQNIPLFDALSRSSIRTVLATSETAAGFMAIGYYRATGRPGVFAGIPGPGFAFALPALAEAALDSAAVLFITGDRVSRGRLYDHQAIDQDTVAAAICGTNFHVGSAGEIAETAGTALSETTRAGHKPVVLQVASAAFQGDCTLPDALAGEGQAVVDLDLPGDLAERLGACNRPLLLAGAGALDSAEDLARFARTVNAMIITTPAARGIVPESDPMVIPVDLLSDDSDALNRLVEESDLVIALGCRFSHNTTGGFALKLPEDRLVHVHEDPKVLNANYPARWAINSPVVRFLAAVERAGADISRAAGGQWNDEQAGNWRRQILRRSPDAQLEPAWPAGAVGCKAIFDELRSVLPDDAILVTDTGMHQIVTRKYYEVKAPRGLVVPTDFQSMGFGLPAAIGAAIACPDRKVVALVGDGTLMMMLAELATIAREKLPVVVIVFADGWLGQIRMQQIEWGASETETRLASIGLSDIASGFGIGYHRCGQGLVKELKQSLSSTNPALLEVPVGEPPRLANLKTRQRRKEQLKGILGPNAARFLKKLAGRQ